MPYAFIFDCVTYNSTMTLHFGFDVEENQTTIVSPSFSKSSIFPHTKTQIQRFQIPLVRFKERFQRSPFSWQISAPGTMGITVKIKLRVECGLGLDQFVGQTAWNCKNLRLLERVQMHVYKSLCLAANFRFSWSISNSSLLREKKSILRPCYSICR